MFDSVESVEVLYSCNCFSDHMPLSMSFKCDKLPDVISDNVYSEECNNSILWTSLTSKQLEDYRATSEKLLSNLSINYETLTCNNIHCTQCGHKDLFRWVLQFNYRISEIKCL